MCFIFTKKEICKNLPNISLFDTRPLNLIWIWTWNKIKYTSLSTEQPALTTQNTKYETENILNWKQKLSKNSLKYIKLNDKWHNNLNRMFGFNEPECTVWAWDYLHFSISRICWVIFVNYNTSASSDPQQLPGVAPPRLIDQWEAAQRGVTDQWQPRSGSRLTNPAHIGGNKSRQWLGDAGTILNQFAWLTSSTLFIKAWVIQLNSFRSFRRIEVLVSFEF